MAAVPAHRCCRPRRPRRPVERGHGRAWPKATDITAASRGPAPSPARPLLPPRPPPTRVGSPPRWGLTWSRSAWPDLFFARNLHLAYALGPLSAPPELRTEYQLDLQEFGAQDNIVTVAVDLDDDGRDDVVLADGLGRVLTLYNDPNGILVPRTLTDTPVLPAMVGTVLAQDVDGDGVVDLVAGATRYKAGDLLPGEFAVARGTGDGGFEPLAAWTTSVGPTETSSPWGPQICYVHLALLDLDGSGYPALVYALRLLP